MSIHPNKRKAIDLVQSNTDEDLAKNIKILATALNESIEHSDVRTKRSEERARLAAELQDFIKHSDERWKRSDERAKQFEEQLLALTKFQEIVQKYLSPLWRK